MPYFVAGCMTVVWIESVTGPGSNVIPLVRAPVFADNARSMTTTLGPPLPD